MRFQARKGHPCAMPHPFHLSDGRVRRVLNGGRDGLNEVRPAAGAAARLLQPAPRVVDWLR
jgi:hypothetical protein